MKKTILSIATLILLTLGLFSCEKESNETNVENFVNESIANLEATTRTGRGGCFELVFPVNIAFPDEAQTEVNSYMEMKDAIKKWRNENKSPDIQAFKRPRFVFPIEVITKEGETVSVENTVELIGLRKECKAQSKGLGRPCFKLNFPISVIYPDETTKSFENWKEMRKALRDWKQNNNDGIERPILSFPISVTLEDGTVQVINTRKELYELKESCN